LKSEAGGSVQRRSQIARFFRALSVLSIFVFASLSLLGQDASSSSDSDELFAHAVQDYTQNRLTQSRTEFEKIRGAHAQEAQQYIAKVNAYLEDMRLADSIMHRSRDELDAPNLEFAIQKYEDALKIKPDGPFEPAQRLEVAKTLYGRVAQQLPETMELRDRNFCAKSLEAAKERHYKEAARYSCLVANDNPAYSCGGDEAVHMCEQMTDLAEHHLTSVESSNQSSTPLIDQARAAYEKNDFAKAIRLLAKVTGEQRPAADEYLDKISRYNGLMAQAEELNKASASEEARVAFTNAANIKPDGPGNPHAQASLMQLEEGIEQFYSGDYLAATRNLENYAQQNSEKQALAHFYLGACKLARFFITGNEDASLKQDALHDLTIAKQAGYKAKRQDLSPRILQAYNDLRF
jgi:hypothetical protein